MNIRHCRQVVIAGLLAGGISIVAPRAARAQETNVSAERGGPITLVGCLQTEQIGDKEKYILAKPIQGRQVTVNEPACSVADTSDAVVLKDVDEHHLNRWPTGRWMMITGRLEGMEHNPERRELHVKSYRVPDLTPRVAQFALPPDPDTIPSSIALNFEGEQPVATAGIREALPKTATALPLVGLIGLISLFGGFIVRQIKDGAVS